LIPPIINLIIHRKILVNTCFQHLCLKHKNKSERECDYSVINIFLYDFYV
jgi:hypothetical protein